MTNKAKKPELDYRELASILVAGRCFDNYTNVVSCYREAEEKDKDKMLIEPEAFSQYWTKQFIGDTEDNFSDIVQDKFFEMLSIATKNE